MFVCAIAANWVEIGNLHITFCGYPKFGIGDLNVTTYDELPGNRNDQLTEKPKFWVAAVMGAFPKDAASTTYFAISLLMVPHSSFTHFLTSVV